MPEVLTKHPEILKSVLSSAPDVRCGVGESQRILTRCKPESFCSFPGGEVCIYGTDELDNMTQLSRTDILNSQKRTSPWGYALAGTTALAGTAALVAGAFLVRSFGAGRKSR